MAINFGSDGTLSVNSVKYNYYQNKNMIADSDYDNTSGYWSLSNCALVANDAIAYRSYRCLQFNPSVTSMSTQGMETPKAGNKYYGGCMWKTTSSSYSQGDGRFEWYVNDNANGKMMFADHYQHVATNGQWKLMSSVQSLSSVASGSWIIRNFTVNATTTCYTDRLIIVNLTEMFGADIVNRYTDAFWKDWCDKHLLEWNGWCGSNNILPQHTVATMAAATDPNWRWPNLSSISRYKYGNEGTNTMFKDYCYAGTCSTSVSETFMYSVGTLPMTNGKYYYAGFDARFGNAGDTYDFYWPEAEPRLGAHTSNNGTKTGPSMSFEKIGFYNIRNSWATGNYAIRIDFNNNYTAFFFFITNLALFDVSALLVNLAAYGGMNVNINDLNKEFFRRFYFGRGATFVRIKDPTNIDIKFKTNYDIECNDIDINPTVNTITFDPTSGTITCKKLVKVVD